MLILYFTIFSLQVVIQNTETNTKRNVCFSKSFVLSEHKVDAGVP